MTKQIDDLMMLADEWADECAGCDGSHLAEQSARRKTLRNALETALAQGEPANRRAHDTAMRQWEHWKQYALELQERLAKYEGGSPMILNTAPPTHAHDSEPAAYVLMSSYLIDGKAEVSLAFEKPESEGYASVIPLYVSQSVHTHKSAPEQTPPPRLAGGDWRHARLEDGDDVVLRALAKAYRFAVTGVGRNVGQYRGLIEAAIQQAQTQTATQVVVPLRLTDDQIMGIAQSLGWWTVDKEIAADALRLSCAIEATVRKQFGAE